MGRVALALRSTHFQSSLMRARSPAGGVTNWMVLNSVVRLTFKMLRTPGCTTMLSRNTGNETAQAHADGIDVRNQAEERESRPFRRSARARTGDLRD